MNEEVVMGVFSRFTDIINSNINSLLDKAEDPAKMVRLIIQEMEDTLVEVRSSSAKTLADKKELSRQAQRFEKDAEQWQEKAELALSKGRDDLARAALLEKKKCTESAESLVDELSHVDEHITKLQGEISQLQEKLADAKARQKAIIMREKTASSRLKVKKNIDSERVNDALSRFDNYERKIDDIEAQVEAYDMGSKSLADEIADLENDENIDDELAQLKAKMKTDKKELDLVKGIIRSKLNTTEISIVYYILVNDGKTVETTYTDMAKHLKMTQGNTSREIAKLIDKGVVGKRKNGIYVKALSSWKKVEHKKRVAKTKNNTEKQEVK